MLNYSHFFLMNNLLFNHNIIESFSSLLLHLPDHLPDSSHFLDLVQTSLGAALFGRRVRGAADAGPQPSGLPWHPSARCCNLDSAAPGDLSGPTFLSRPHCCRPFLSREKVSWEGGGTVRSLWGGFLWLCVKLWWDFTEWVKGSEFWESGRRVYCHMPFFGSCNYYSMSLPSCSSPLPRRLWFSHVCCLFVSLSARLDKNWWTHFHEKLDGGWLSAKNRPC